MSIRTILIGLSLFAAVSCTPENNEGGNGNGAAGESQGATTSQPAKTGKADLPHPLNLEGVRQEGDMIVGGPGISDGDRVAVADVLADPKAYEGKKVRIEGPVAATCAMKGCWGRIGTDDQNVLLQFPDFYNEIQLPKEANGEIVAEGELVVEEMSVDELKHYAEDEGKSAEEIAKITEPQTKVKLKGVAYQFKPAK